MPASALAPRRVRRLRDALKRVLRRPVAGTAEIGERDDADKLLLVIDHRQAANLMTGHDLGRLIDFASRWDRTAPMVVHCFAGISRSTAGAFVAACAINPQRDEQEIAWAIRRASRTAQPNARIVAIADQLLKRDGRMVRAVETIGPGQAAVEGEPFRLDLG